MKRPTKMMKALALFVVILCEFAIVQGMPFNGCGNLIQGPNCLLFAHNGNPQSLFVLSNYGNFHSGDHVCVIGDLTMGCQTSCAGAIGCVQNDSIHAFMPPGSFQACGVLVFFGNCQVFAPAGSPGTHYRLDHYGGFHAGDSVCVSGVLDSACQHPCQGLDGCIRSNSIMPTGPHGSYFCGCGVIVADSSCVVFAPNGEMCTRFVLDNAGGFQVGDTVRVCGNITAPCSTSCDGVAACVVVDSINYCLPPPVIPMLGHVVLRLVNADSLDAIAESIGSSVVDSIAQHLTYLLRFNDSLSVDALLELLRLHPEVTYAEPNFEMSLPEVLQMSMSFPDENAPPLVLGVSPASYYDQPAAYSIGVDSAQVRTHGDGVIVAVVDNGIRLTHPLFAGAFAGPGYDFFDNDADPSEEPGEAFGHGTFVAGLIKLTAPDCKLLPLRAFDSNGVGSSFAIAQGIYYAIDHGADIINMSFGVYDNSSALVKACSTAVAAGVTLVAATGNDSTLMPIYPAALPGVIAVSALDTTNAIANFSNFGYYMDVCSPGVKLYSTLAGTYEWGTWSGTSFAAALVSGTCALAAAVDTSLKSLEMQSHIRASASRTLGGMTITPPDLYYGYGRINAADAVWSLGSTPIPLRGDADGSGNIDVSDAVYLCDFIFRGGPAPELDLGDVNCDLSIDISDVVYLIAYIFTGGQPPGCLQ